jgi:hypothetical protein
LPDSGDPDRIDERLRRATRGAFDLWLDAGRWWAGAVVESAGVWRAENARLLADTVAEVARRLQGHRFETVYGNRAFRATIEQVDVDRTPSHGVRLTLGDAVWDDVPIERLLVLADELSIEPPPAVALTLSEISVQGRVRLTELAAWLTRTFPRWGFAVTPDNLIEAARPGRRRRFTLEAAIADGELQVVVHQFSWSVVRLPIPERMRPVRRIPLPPVPDGVVLTEARPDGDVVAFTIRLPRIRRPLPLPPLI